MSASLILSMGSPKIAFVSYAYSINMQYITLSLMTGKLLVIYVYNLRVLKFATSIAANKQVVLSSHWGKYVTISSASWPIFVYLVFFLFDQNVQNIRLRFF